MRNTDEETLVTLPRSFSWNEPGGEEEEGGEAVTLVSEYIIAPQNNIREQMMDYDLFKRQNRDEKSQRGRREVNTFQQNEYSSPLCQCFAVFEGFGFLRKALHSIRKKMQEKRILSNRRFGSTQFYCSCTRCRFERSIVTHYYDENIDYIKNNNNNSSNNNSNNMNSFKDKDWDVISLSSDAQLSIRDYKDLGAWYLSEMKYNLSAAILVSVIKRLMAIAERDDDSSISTSTSEQYGVKMAFVLADALHCLATLLLEIVATNTVLPSSRTIRMHWRSACKLWLNCTQVCPSHAMAKKQIEKLLAYGCYDFINEEISLESHVQTTDRLEEASEQSPPVKFSVIEVPSAYSNRKRKQDELSSLYLCKTLSPIITNADCEFIIREVENYAKLNSGSYKCYFFKK